MKSRYQPYASTGPYALRKSTLTSFLLNVIAQDSYTIGDLVARLTATGHPTRGNKSLVGPLARLTASRYLDRHRLTGRYRLTPKGERYRRRLNDRGVRLPGTIYLGCVVELR